MSELKTYEEWEKIFCEETDHKIYDDGLRMVKSEQREDDLITKEEAFKYYSLNTIFGNIFKDR